MGTSYFLWRQAGLGLASELLLTGRQLGAERAYQVERGGRCTCGVGRDAGMRGRSLHGRQWHRLRPHAFFTLPRPQVGLVNELVEEPADLEAAARKLAAEMLACSRLGLQARGGRQCGACCHCARCGRRRRHRMPAAALPCPCSFVPSPMPPLSCLQLTKEQLCSVADGGSLRAALTAENSHQMLLASGRACSRAVGAVRARQGPACCAGACPADTDGGMCMHAAPHRCCCAPLMDRSTTRRRQRRRRPGCGRWSPRAAAAAARGRSCEGRLCLGTWSCRRASPCTDPFSPVMHGPTAIQPQRNALLDRAPSESQAGLAVCTVSVQPPPPQGLKSSGSC